VRLAGQDDCMLSVRVCADAPVGSAAKNATATAVHSVVPRTFLMRILPSDGDGSEKVRKRSRAFTLSRGELRNPSARNWRGLGLRVPTGWNLVRAPREWSRSAAIRCGIDCGRDNYRRSARRPATIDTHRYGRQAVLPTLS